MLPLTVKDLREVLRNLSDDIIISYERIEDVYFDDHNWDIERVSDSSDPGSHDKYTDEYINAEVCWYDELKNKLRISAHY